jgi:hypothetical protein
MPPAEDLENPANQNSQTPRTLSRDLDAAHGIALAASLGLVAWGIIYLLVAHR